MPDFYDDAILEFDSRVREMTELLKEQGVYDRTLLIINTDHGSRWTINQRLPLILRFPGGEHSGLHVCC